MKSYSETFFEFTNIFVIFHNIDKMLKNHLMEDSPLTVMIKTYSKFSNLLDGNCSRSTGERNLNTFIPYFANAEGLK